MLNIGKLVNIMFLKALKGLKVTVTHKQKHKNFTI
jgi:hypothetical protein